MAAAKRETATFRKVILLRPSENKRLQKIAREKNVSTSEIIRRSLDAYVSEASTDEQEEMRTVLAQMNQALDQAIESVRSARAEIGFNLAQIHQRRSEMRA